MTKEKIISRLSCLSEEQLNEMIDIYRKHRVRKVEGGPLFTVPKRVLEKLDGPAFKVDKELKSLVENLPDFLRKVDEPSKAYIEKCRSIYTSRCFKDDDIGRLLVQKSVEYATSYKTKPLFLYGAPGCGKSHLCNVYSEMLGLPLYRIDAPLSVHGGGLSGENAAYQNASSGAIVKGMIATGACNYLLVTEEIDKEEIISGRVSLSDQFLKILDQDAKNFRDNRLEFNINAEHVVHIFTANDKSHVSAPLLDRCDVIEIKALTKTEISDIVRGSVIPQALEHVTERSEVSFSDEAIEFVVDSLWKRGATSLRPYQRLVDNCVSGANFKSLVDELPVNIKVCDVEPYLINNGSVKGDSRMGRIGF